MKLKNKTNLAMFFVFAILLIFLFSFVSAVYAKSGVQFINPGGSFSSGTGIDKEMCDAGQDFILQIAPFGCTPSVRTDLLEERNTPVFCQIAATKINPLIDVNAIDSISFKGKYPDAVAGIDFHPAQAALGVKGKLNSPVLENIGYVVITLKKQENASAVPNFVQGNLTATLKYNIKNAFGIGNAEFYLPEMSDADWDSKHNQYSFWDGRFYLRATGIDANSALISIYNDAQKISSVELEKGKTSDLIHVPGFDCLAGLKLNLNGLVAPDTRAKLKVNADTVEVVQGEKFLENKCSVNKIDKKGIIQRVEISCTTDDGRKNYPLSISPKVELDRNGAKEIYGLGDKVFSDSSNNDFYLGFIGKNESEELYIRLVQLPFGKNFGNLSEGMLSEVADDDSGGHGIFAKHYLPKGNKIGKEIKINSNDEEFGTGILFVGLSGPQDKELDSTTKMYYQNATDDYRKVADNFEGEKEEGVKESFGERALFNLIVLSKNLEQKKTLIELCDEFEQKYPESKLDIPANCNGGFEFSSSESDGVDVLIDGNYKKISLKGIYEPSKEEYSAEINIGSDPEVQKLKKNQEYLLSAGGTTEGGSSTATPDYKFVSVDSAVKNAYGPDSLCLKYVNEVIESSEKQNIDPLLLMAVMKRESSCKSDADSETAEFPFCKGASYGLMQISGKKWCGKYGLPQNPEADMAQYCKDNPNYVNTDCVKQLKENTKLNIEVGEQILKDYYEQYKNGVKNSNTYKTNNNFKTLVDSCITKYPKYGTYSGWEATLRAYNGFGCRINADVDYVENVMREYGKLGGTGTSSGQTSSGTTTSAEFIRLEKLTDEYAEFYISVKDDSVKSNKFTLKPGESKVIGDKSRIFVRLNKINLKKQARVSVQADINRAGTEANFPFKIGIEKRAIKLSPEQTREKIEDLNKSIKQWEKISGNLGKVVKGMKTACLGVGAYTTLKNLFANLGGKSIARYEVMRSDKGWYDKCRDKVTSGDYKTISECLTKEANNIESDVNKYYNGIKAYNEEVKQFKNEDAQKFKKDYLESVREKLKTDLNGTFGDTFKIDDKDVKIDDFVNNLTASQLSVEELRNLVLNSRVGGSDALNAMTKTGLEKSMTEIYEEIKNAKQIKQAEENAKENGFEGVRFTFGRTKDTREEEYYGFVASKALGQIQIRDNIQGYVEGGKDYFLKLEKLQGSNNEYKVSNVYDLNGIEITAYNKDFSKNLIYKMFDASSYKNTFKGVAGEDRVEPYVKYYETEPNKGLPALVPFDLENGWYAATKNTLPVFGAISAYEESGRVSSFYICNVGENGIAEVFVSGFGDDECRQVNRGTGQPSSEFPRLNEADARKIINCGNDAIEDASRKFTQKGTISINAGRCGNVKVEVGKPAVDVPDLQCQDIMSPKDCQLLFNVCDPVICPSSRCDLGGKYPVSNVIQSGIIGSIALCLPNAREGILMPVCLTGVKAGVDGFVSMEKSYRDCLQTSLETGKQVGICDEFHSLYLCDLFWREGLPIAKLAIPKGLELLKGQGSRGGGEYLGVQDAWSNADRSVKLFTQYYADDSYKAFKARSTEEAIGGEVCKNYVSSVVPSSGSALDKFTEPDSPVQFYGRFDEIPYTTATNPPMSHYKVFYHIYAGEDIGTSYKVYFRGGESSYYQDTGSIKMIAQGYIPKGKSASETPDILEVSGYKQICIMVNEQEECGFKQVTTEFSINYIKDKYAAQQADVRNIKTTTECNAGSASLYSLASPNIQGGVEEVVNPAIYNRGIIRICATDNPGEGTDNFIGLKEQRWIEVGYCDDPKMKCWLDTDSVEKIIKNQGIEDDVLEKQEKKQREILENRGEYISPEDFKIKVTEIEDKKVVAREKINLINKIIDKVFLSVEKARLYLLRGDAYGEMAGEEKKKTGTNIVDTSCTASGYEEHQCTTASECKDFNGNWVSNKCTQFKVGKGYEYKNGAWYEYDSSAGGKIDGQDIRCCVIEGKTPGGTPEEGKGDGTDSTDEPQGNEQIIREGSPPSNIIVFTFEDGEVLDGDIYFYFDKAWWWSSDEKTWIDSSSQGSSQDAQLNSVGRLRRNVLMRKLPQEDRDFITKYLVNKDYEQGFEGLINRTIENDEGGWFDNTKLSTDKIELSSDGVFTFKPVLESTYLKFDNQQKKWQWSFAGLKGFITDPEKIMDIGGDRKFLEEQKEFLESLNGKNLYEGAKIIFGINAE